MLKDTLIIECSVFGIICDNHNLNPSTSDRCNLLVPSSPKATSDSHWSSIFAAPMSPRSSDVAAQDHEKGSPCYKILGKDMKAMKARGVRTQHTQFLEFNWQRGCGIDELGHACKCPKSRTNFSFVTLYCLKHMPRYCGTLTLLFALEGSGGWFFNYLPLWELWGCLAGAWGLCRSRLWLLAASAWREWTLDACFILEELTSDRRKGPWTIQPAHWPSRCMMHPYILDTTEDCSCANFVLTSV